MKSVLFVCMGNICRSPAAEGVMQAVIAKHSFEEEVSVDSAGTIGYHAGELADPRMRKAAADRGYTLNSVARQFTEDDFARFDLIVAMDRDNKRDIAASGSGPKHRNQLRLLSDFLSKSSGFPLDVPDPYYGGDDGFETVLNMIEAACETILFELMGSKVRML